MIERKDFSEEQETAFKYILEFVNSNKRQMVLSGYAGTGKTTLLNALLNYFDTNGSYEIYCTAPTNEAVRVISKLTNRHQFYKTIYSLLGLALIQEDDKPPKLKVSSDSKVGEYDLIFIDEASMIQDELFDLIQDQLRQHSYLKIIYIGDDAQLPPVKNEGEPSKVFNIKDGIKLIQVQRTAKENPIIEIATAIRENLFSKEDVFKHETILKNDMGIVFYKDRAEFLNSVYTDFTSKEYKIDPNFVRVIAYTNKTVNILNRNIRKQMFKTEELKEYMVDEDLIVDEPVINPDDRTIIFTVGTRLCITKVNLFEDHENGLKYWNLTIKNYEHRMPSLKIINVIHKDYIKAYRYVLSKYANEAKIAMTKTKAKKWKIWEPYFKFKNQFSWVKYSYATTIHKSQGGTFKNVYVINADCNKLTWNDIERNKLKYVAITRASHLVKII